MKNSIIINIYGSYGNYGGFGGERWLCSGRSGGGSGRGGGIRMS